jgi:hypothetical protein
MMHRLTGGALFNFAHRILDPTRRRPKQQSRVSEQNSTAKPASSDYSEINEDTGAILSPKTLCLRRRRCGMKSPKLVVTISRDTPLQITRTLLLQHSGYRVVALGSDDAVREFLRLPHQTQPNLVLMCHSVPEASRVALYSGIKYRFPSAPILTLHKGYDSSAADVDGRMENMRDPQALLDTVQFMLSTEREKPARTVPTHCV